MKDTSNSLSASACNGESERAKEQEMKDKSTPSIASDCYEKSEGAKEQEMKDTSAPLDAFDGEKKSEGALAPDLSVEQRRKNRRVARRRQQKRRKQRIKEEKNENKVRRFEKLVTERALKMEADLLETMEAERKNAAKYLSLARKYYGMWKATNEELQLFRQHEKASIAEGDYSTSKKVSILKDENLKFPSPATSLTLDERFSEYSNSGTFKLTGETLNISSGVLPTQQ
ncbi:uncharacterized protein [Pocillopora verrucosa]|uniref:uncharacterized protein n=1 Tax=Pocillopora verrucosa TaxID=203993 RepID=UPI0033408402